jgi:hypothetical protein
MTERYPRTIKIDNPPSPPLEKGGTGDLKLIFKVIRRANSRFLKLFQEKLNHLFDGLLNEFRFNRRYPGEGNPVISAQTEKVGDGPAAVVPALF